MDEPHTYPISRLVNWCYENYCTRKCFDDPELLSRHNEQLHEFAMKNPSLRMTRVDFKAFFNDSMIICSLDEDFKRKSIGWGLFSILQRIPEYNSKDIIVKDGKLVTKEGQLPAPREECAICKKLRVPR